MFNPYTQTQQRDSPAYTPVTVYGTRWCAATQGVRRFFDRYGIPCIYRDLETDPYAERQIRWWTGGYASHPTVQIGGDILVEPTAAELHRALARNRLAKLDGAAVPENRSNRYIR